MIGVVLFVLATFAVGLFVAWLIRDTFGGEKSGVINDALAITCGSIGAVFLAVGIVPTSGASAGPPSLGHYFVVVSSPFLLNWGLRLILIAFGLQMDKVATNLKAMFALKKQGAQGPQVIEKHGESVERSLETIPSLQPGVRDALDEAWSDGRLTFVLVQATIRLERLTKVLVVLTIALIILTGALTILTVLLLQHR